jgi:hypothetical protein
LSCLSCPPRPLSTKHLDDSATWGIPASFPKRKRETTATKCVIPGKDTLYDGTKINAPPPLVPRASGCRLAPSIGSGAPPVRLSRPRLRRVQCQHGSGGPSCREPFQI